MEFFKAIFAQKTLKIIKTRKKRDHKVDRHH